MSAKVISFINMKGGVGKTTLSIGIADYLSDFGEKVLIIDADPQFNATQALLDAFKEKIDDEEDNYYSKEVLEKEKTIFKLFKPQVDVKQEYFMPKREDLIINLKENLDILCGDLNLVLVNKSSDYSLIKRIRNYIEENNLREIYTYILIDCPPTLNTYTDSALMASDYYLIPNRIDRYSIVGIDSLQRAIKSLIREERINLKCLGLIYTMISNIESKKQEKIRIQFESKDTVKDIYIFNSKSTEVRDIQRGAGGSLPTKYKASREDIETICSELVNRIDIVNRR